MSERFYCAETQCCKCFFTLLKFLLRTFTPMCTQIFSRLCGAA